jgi:hypothetical protein
MKTNDTIATLRKNNLPKPEKVRDAQVAPAGTARKIASENRNGNPHLSGIESCEK